MARNLQNCYCSFEAAEARAKELEAKTGKPYMVTADECGYWRPIIDRFKLNTIRVIQAHARAVAFDASKKAKAADCRQETP